MNLGISELSILGILALLVFGGVKLSKKPKKKNEITTVSSKKETDLRANYQNINTDLDNTPVKKSNPNKPV